ncbi:hypothetical protein TNCV_4102901 [Trichonephila clavipes]|nr:hypothetical protein TNCV_4102901 [Trichonephila clavipes]
MVQHLRFQHFIFTPPEQAQGVAWFIEFKSATPVQRKWGPTTLEFWGEKKFPGRRMERGDPIPRSTKFRDITLLGIFLKEYF